MPRARLAILMVIAVRAVPTGGTFAMLITVFRSRLNPGLTEEYDAAVARMSEPAETLPGYISHKTSFAADSERCTIVEFEHEEGL
jgi:hypothetical protein